MKTTIKYLSIAAFGALASLSACSSKNDATPATVYMQEDQFGRPAINTVFNDAPQKDAFNVTIPSAQAAAYTTLFKTKLLALNAGYTTNLLTLNADAFIGVLSTDVLSVALSGPTTFYNGTQVLTGRALGDDVIDVELILIFGGPDATANPGLTSDHVSANDHAFLSTFPYLAAAN